MSTFERAVAEILRQEGGLADNPHDPGGLTNYGISQRAYPSLDIRALTEADARAIYRRDYWLAPRLDRLPPGLALAAFDCAVNQGTGTAVRLLQAALGVTVDGVIGPKTEAAARTAGPGALTHFMASRIVRYAALPTFPRFGLGWARRCFEIHAQCIELDKEGAR